MLSGVKLNSDDFLGFSSEFSQSVRLCAQPPPDDPEPFWRSLLALSLFPLAGQAQLPRDSCSLAYIEIEKYSDAGNSKYLTTADSTLWCKPTLELFPEVPYRLE